MAAVGLVIVVGKRKGYGEREFSAHNATYVYIGTALLWFGWMGFDGGSALASNSRGAGANIASHLAACMGGLTWTILDRMHQRRGFGAIPFW